MALPSYRLDLFVRAGLLNPQRVLIYLYEKNLISAPYLNVVSVDLNGMTAPNKPPGTVPMLRVPDGTIINQSIAIIDFFEDLCENPMEEWHKEFAKIAMKGSMRGNTAQERARTREKLGIADELTLQIGWAAHKGNKLFSAHEETNVDASRLMLQCARKTMRLLEKYYTQETRTWESGEVTVAECVLFAILAFANDFYGIKLAISDRFPALARFYEEFGKRESTKISPGEWESLAHIGEAMGQSWMFEDVW
ncbi:hypothetical protein VHEMI10683 [[Torrubiella] hemipterigena]|uniref:GST N-terminal domain-containing protein n=1 Tax=[Torrubiella] hemipterigena TaxID=1531966 RepID=A0A0A1TDX5_9HYPO|nr:hypothetical protein VHEMI10683 [[Torrubiella] hemipterigena]